MIVVLIAGLILNSCYRNSNKGEIKALDTRVLVEKVEQIAPDNKGSHPGKTVYLKYCMQCHQADGSGVSGLHPPLRPNKWISGDKERLIEITLKGLYGEIKVEGEIYNSLMPPHNHLTDLELADVLSYVRSSFGNDLSSISQKEVVEVRQKLKR